MAYTILVLNPGSTSTKAAVYQDDRPLLSKSIVHTNHDLAPYPTLNDQLDYRVALVRGWLGQEGFDLSSLSAVVGRGGIIPNIVAGGYVVDDALADCLLHHTVFDHASNLGGLMARLYLRRGDQRRAAPRGPGHRLQGGHPHQLLPCAQRPGHRPQVRPGHGPQL